MDFNQNISIFIKKKQAQATWETMLKLVLETFCMGKRQEEALNTGDFQWMKMQITIVSSTMLMHNRYGEHSPARTFDATKMFRKS